jgi:DNA-binding LacI/PurR family transcriptional regulator
LGSDCKATANEDNFRAMKISATLAPATPSGKSATLDDVAARAGVSTATVSRFINNPTVVAETTAVRIREAIAATGYIPNLLAGGLASSRSKMVAVMIPYLTDSIFNDTMQAMVEELSASGTTVMLGLTGVSEARTEDLIRAALSRRVDAIIFTGPMTQSVEQMVRRSRALFIQVWELPENPIGIAVGFSHNDAGRDIARFALSRGYRRPHLITANGARARMRRDGFVEEWQANGAGETIGASSLCASARVFGSNNSARSGESSGLSARRYGVCSGGSRWSGGRLPVKATLGTTFCTDVMKVDESEAARFTSSYRVNAQKPPSPAV